MCIRDRHIALQAAVGLDRDEAALGTQTLALGRDDLNVVRVDFRHDHGHFDCNLIFNKISLVITVNRMFALGF